jgi:NAD(P)-dependent dehydrogenase (short-subunit alcohol dehydrogenase family)
MSGEQKVALSTGASQEIGASLVRGFLGCGHRVVANSRTIKPSGAEDAPTIADTSSISRRAWPASPRRASPPHSRP